MGKDKEIVMVIIAMETMATIEIINKEMEADLEEFLSNRSEGEMVIKIMGMIFSQTKSSVKVFPSKSTKPIFLQTEIHC